MGLLDEIMKSLEEAQRQAEGRRAPPSPPPARPLPERKDDRAEADEADEDDEPVPVRRAPPPVRRPVQPIVVAAAKPMSVPPTQRPASSVAAVARHVLVGKQAAERIRALMRNPQSLRDALVAREILGPPPGLRRLRRRG